MTTYTRDKAGINKAGTADEIFSIAEKMENGIDAVPTKAEREA